MHSTVDPISPKELYHVARKNCMAISKWLFLNVVLAMLPLGLAMFCYLLAPDSFSPPALLILRGDVMLIVITLCATSIGYFTEINAIQLRNAKEPCLWITLLVLVLSAAAGPLLGGLYGKGVIKFNESALMGASWILFFFGVLSCLGLYIASLASKEYDYAENEAMRNQALEMAAKKADSTSDNLNL